MKKKILIPLLYFNKMQAVLKQKFSFIPYNAPEEEPYYE